MDSTIQALGGILLRAIPTFILVFLLHIYLKRVFFGPLDGVLAKRREATEGAREAAESALRLASEKAAGYEAALNDARADIFRDQEETRKRWLADQARYVEESRVQAQELIARAKVEIAGDTEAARHELESVSGALATQLSQRVLAGRLN